jgi:FlaA1/EpsC-like NDP-sugar epimerase
MLDLDTATQDRLLGRSLHDVLTDTDRHRLRGQRVLVTGAGGDVGSELSRQLASCRVGRLALMDHAEPALGRVQAELRNAYPDVPLVSVLGDVTRPSDLRGAFEAAEPAVVYHAAAYTDVTFAETTIVQALRVNALGAADTARAARRAGARFVLISSHKAAQPHSVMGATKRFAEHVTLCEATPAFRPIVVRLGSILGCSGSVVEIMLARAAAGLRLPVTDPEATRYFMTASEAVTLVLTADLIGRQPGIFWLDVGDPIRIGDLTARIVGHTASLGFQAVGTEIIGLRPGEKMHEATTEGQRTHHPGILSASQTPISPAIVKQGVAIARRACAAGDAAAALAALSHLVVDYVPSDAAIAHVTGAASRPRVKVA